MEEHNRASATELMERLTRRRDNRRVLSIQSHVVSGYAGNKCSIFPLQLHGFEVDWVNSVQFSNHTGYPGGVTGTRLNDKDLLELYTGLKKNGLTNYSHVLSGYCGDASFLRQIAKIVKELKSSSEHHLTYICDPVLGDNGSYYVPEALTDIYLKEIIPLADIITPNIFELGELTGTKVKTEEECLRAIHDIHIRGNVNIVVVTSGLFERNGELMICYASERRADPAAATGFCYRRYRYEIPVIEGHFVGTGDVFTALLLSWLECTNGDLMQSVRNVIASLQLLLRRTHAEAFAQGNARPSAAQLELRLIQSRYDLLMPAFDVVCKEVSE